MSKLLKIAKINFHPQTDMKNAHKNSTSTMLLDSLIK